LPVAVLHVSQPTLDGVATCVARLVAAQHARGWRVGVASPREGLLLDETEAGGAAHFEWQARRSPGPRVLAETVRLARIVESFAPDVVHLHSSKAGLAGRLVIRGRIPTLFQPHAWSFEAQGIAAAFARPWERFGGRWLDLVLCCSQAELDEGRRAGVRAKAEVVPNAVDLRAFRPGSAADRSEARARLGLGSEPLVVCIGRLSPQKGQDLLLQAWPEILAAAPTAVLALVGDGPEREALERRAVARVQILGRRNDVADWLTAADVVALPSRYEGMSLTLLEAMACARPVVAHDVEGMREALAPPGRTPGGALVPLGDTALLSEAIVARILDPELAAAEGGAGRRLVEESHDLSNWTERVSLVTERVAARRQNWR
jgi:glycosyltransferase involved in cell wall biosynthesis